jgi:predicted O-methyltransferase YrrM
MEDLKNHFNFTLPEGVSEEMNFKMMKPWIEGKKKFLEIGFNTGYSAAFFLENGADKVVSFDICRYGYEEKAHEIIEKNHPGKQKFDFIFVDGFHWGKWPDGDIRNCLRFAHKDTILCVDNMSFKVSSEILYKYNWPENKYYNVTDAWNKLVLEDVIKPDIIDCRYDGNNKFPTCMAFGKYSTYDEQS